MSITASMSDKPRDRGVSITNGEARDWLAANGWMSRDSGQLHLSGDRLSAGSFNVRRVWHTPAWLQHRGTRYRESSVLVIVGVEGEGTVRNADVSARFGVGRIVVASTETDLELDFAETSARMEIITTRGRLGLERFHSAAPLRVLQDREGYARHLGSLVNSVLGSEVRSGDLGFPALRDAMESSMTALIAQSSDGWSPVLTSARAELLRRAWSIIEERHVDPDFSVSQLSDTLQVSTTHLHRVFAAASLTPFHALQQRRARRAAQLLNQGRVTGADELARVAGQCGFPSVAVMRRALTKHGHWRTTA